MYFLSQTYRQFYPNTHTYQYDANGNMVLDSIGRVMKDGHLEENISKRQLLWDDENRLLAINDNGYVSSYLYNANGDRTVKLSGNNEAVYVNTIPSANETQTDRFTIYPSPYMVFANGGRYTKHIYIGSERIASKVAIDNGYDPRTTQTAAYGNNIYVASLNNKSTALNDSIEAIYTKFQLPFNGLNNDDIIQGFQPSLMSLASTASSTDNYEEYSYYIHSDHLGSTSYVTDANGAVSQHVEYVPFGEVFIEELSSSTKLNTPFLFNGKELDEETGLYYYGARYYDPQLSLWLSVDPLSNYDPLNNENYLDGEHNSGVYNPFNNSVYSYCYNNPVKLYEPNGKQAVAIHGTWSSNKTWKDQAGINAFTKKKFGHTKHDYRFKWSGGNRAKDRTVGALELISHIRKTRKEHSLTSSEAITLVGHSHGGNVAIEAANLMVNMEEFNDIKINLLTINTPVRDDYQLSSSALKRVTHINVYDPKDPVQIIGGNIYSKIPRGEPTLLDFFGEYGPAGRIFKNAMNIQVNNPQGLFRDFHNSHNRTQDWINK